MKPLEAIAQLSALAPCQIFVNNLPASEHKRTSRSAYFPKRRGRWGRERDFIFINDGRRHWSFVGKLAHELGHALDGHGRLPYQNELGGRRSRYRDELAAVSFEIMACEAMGMVRMVSVERRLDLSVDYLYGYKMGGNPHLAELVNDGNRRKVCDLLGRRMPRKRFRVWVGRSRRGGLCYDNLPFPNQ